MPPLKLELTQEQEFYLENLRRTIPKMSKEELGKFLLESQKQCLAYKNAFKSVFKK